MMRDVLDRHARVVALVHAAGRLADPHDVLGARTRRELLSTTGLSLANVELCLREHLETHASPGEIARLVACTQAVPRAHVLLSANVFVGALRALALAVSSAPQVVVRASRREPSFARAIVEAVADPAVARSISFADELHPAPGEEIHLYGRDQTIVEVCRRLHPDVRVWAHGAGIGVVLLGDDADIGQAADELAADMVPFDQQGCLSPRIVLAHGTVSRAQAFGAALANALQRWQERVPTGRRSAEELAEQTRYRDTVMMLGDVIAAGPGVVGVVEGTDARLVAPTGRSMHVVAVGPEHDASDAIEQLAPHVAALGISPGSRDPWVARMAALLPRARTSALGFMQRPAFDGPVDLRTPGARAPAKVIDRLRRPSSTSRDTGK